MATIAFTKIGSTVKMVKDTTNITYKPAKMVAAYSGTTIRYTYPGNIRYSFTFSTSDTVTADGSPVTGTAVEMVEGLATMFS
jgi:hypothetical protein